MRSDKEITEEELAGIEYRARTASPGPWFSYVVGRDMEAGGNCIELGSCETIELLGGSAADQDFIAHAREDLPRLVCEVRRLRSEIENIARSIQAGSTQQSFESLAEQGSANGPTIHHR